ncbi:hypothetical protein [Methylocapsa palsarum]|uniref:Uncharacterized protein n=1 Tax=Methylocapsa palsarum TaxID=1612308 RepID=A0A1I4CF75_9HYPH|nr:hypothetical protein [Methylocapsa palsarum]SFK79413.1 hypothetical protein SAMN05444581_12137 [Methylocapsa palsarum]
MSKQLNAGNYWAEMNLTRSAEYAASSYERFCTRQIFRSLFEYTARDDPHMSRLARQAYEATFIAEFGVDGAAAGRAEHERLEDEHTAAMCDPENPDYQNEDGRPLKAWRRQFVQIDRRRRA